jgi:hypothetical protein
MHEYRPAKDGEKLTSIRDRETPHETLDYVRYEIE